ncbi:MAG TPA: hypothetical protein VHG35_04365 [Gemmatimonadales bacterium]|nr:hypothetical protein [Gemmatimonadales bacterium]
MDPFTYYCRNEDGRATGGIVRDSTLPSPNTSGLNPVDYVRSHPYPDAISLQELNMESRPEFWRRVYHDGLSAFLNERPVSWNTSALAALAGADSAFDDMLAQRGSLAQAVNLVDHQAYVDCRAATYNYTVSFWIRRDIRDLIPENIREPVDEGYRRLLDALIRDGIDRREPIVINTHIDLVQELASDPALRDRLRERMSENPEQVDGLKALLPDVWSFLQLLKGSTDSIFPFPTGEYRLSGEMSYALDLATEQLLRLRQPGDRYRITVRGFSDARPIRSGIAYSGGADLGLRPMEVRPFSLEGGRSGSGFIRSNLELSVARGHSGAEQIAQSLRERVTSSEDRRRNFEVLYSGGGAVAGQVLDVNRRIDLVIEVQRPESGP